MYAFPLSILLCRFTSQTQPGTLRVEENFSALQRPLCKNLWHLSRPTSHHLPWWRHRHRTTTLPAAVRTQGSVPRPRRMDGNTQLFWVDPGPRRMPARLWGRKDALTPHAETPAGQGRNHSVRLQRCARHHSDSETPRRAGDSPCSHGTSLLSEKQHELINKRLIISIPEKTGPGKGGASGEGVVRTGQGSEG